MELSREDGPVLDGTTVLHGGSSETIEAYSNDWYMFISLAIFCTAFSGLMSGLTVGLLSIDQLDLEIKLKIGSIHEKKSVSL